MTFDCSSSCSLLFYYFYDQVDLEAACAPIATNETLRILVSVLEVRDGTRARPDLKLFILVGWHRSSYVCCLVHWESTDNLLLLHVFGGVVWQSRDLQLSCNTFHLLNPRLCFFIVLKRDLFVYCDNSLTS